MTTSDGFSNQARFTSFRDPAGRLLAYNNQIFRVIDGMAISDLKSFLTSSIGKKLADSGQLVSTRFLNDDDAEKSFGNNWRRSLLNDNADGRIVEHERIPFQSFPYEWPSEMLHQAGLLTIDLAESLLSEGFGLKDATPYNILYRGSAPVFVDLLSFERRDPGDPTWLPLAQFERTFILPLLVNKYFGLSLDSIFITNRDGIEPESAYRLCAGLRRLTPPFLSLVSIPNWLSPTANRDQKTGGGEIYKKKSLSNPEQARFILRGVFKRLRRHLESVAPKIGRSSTWSDYMSPTSHFTQRYFAAKNDFVKGAIDEYRPKRVLDVGCNNGHFSLLSAAGGASVVSIDYDPVVVGDLWHKAYAEKLNILPLAVNLTRPTPSTGWLNQECPSFLDRARGSFDCVLMLAVIHHMLVTERIPLAEIIDLAAVLTTDLLIVEFVPTDDPLFSCLTRGREELHSGLTEEVFKTAASRRFDIVRSQQLIDSSRSIYLMRKKS